MSSEEESHHTTTSISSSSTNSSGHLFTPSGLFIVLNLMIFTIALSSKLSNRKTTPKNHDDHEDEEEEVSHDDDHHQTHTQFPSVAGNFQQFRYQHVSNPENMSPPPSPTNSSSSDPTFDSYGTEDDNSSYGYVHPPRETTEQLPKPNKFRRVKSDVNKPKLRKSWSVRSSSDYNNNNNKEEENTASVEKRRPSTVRDQGKHVAADNNKEVDAMADDFINRFKHQLKLQRMDSFSRYRSHNNNPT